MAPITWEVAREDFDKFDVELARSESQGLKYVAHDGTFPSFLNPDRYPVVILSLIFSSVVPLALGGVNLELQSIDPGDDYFVIFLNASTGMILSLSDKFTIIAADDVDQDSNVGPANSKPSVTIEGSPNPTKTWAFTFGALSGARSSFRMLPGLVMLQGAIFLVLISVFSSCILA